MVTKEQYHEIKSYIKYLSKPEIRKMASDMELTDFESKLLLSTYDGDSVTKICMDNFISNYTYTVNMRIIYSKIRNYRNFKETDAQ